MADITFPHIIYIYKTPNFYIYRHQSREEEPHRNKSMLFSNMSKTNMVRRHVLEKKRSCSKENESGCLSKHLKKIYPIGLQRTSSSLSLSSLSLSLSQNSNDSSLTDHSSTPLEQKISLALSLIAPHRERREFPMVVKTHVHHHHHQQQDPPGNGEVRRCHWVTKNSGKFLP